MIKLANHYCCVVEISGTGILIEGSSGSGKSSLALGLVERAVNRGLQGFLIADDQAILEAKGGVLHARVPPQLAGKVEIRGFGISTTPYKESAAVSIVAKMVGDELVERMPDAATCSVQGLKIPLVKVPIRHEEAAVRIIFACLEAMNRNSDQSAAC